MSGPFVSRASALLHQAAAADRNEEYDAALKLYMSAIEQLLLAIKCECLLPLGS